MNSDTGSLGSGGAAEASAFTPLDFDPFQGDFGSQGAPASPSGASGRRAKSPATKWRARKNKAPSRHPIHLERSHEHNPE